MKDWLRARPWWFWGGVGVVVVLGAFAAGRWMAPTRVETVDTSTTFAAWDWRQAVHETTTAGPTTTTTTTRRATGRPAQPPVPGPAGEPVCPECPPVEETTTVVQGGSVVTVRDTDTAAQGTEATEETHRKVVEQEAPRWLVFGTVGAGFDGSGLTAPAYGGGVAFRFLGPLTAVAQAEGGTGGGSARVGLGITF